MTKAKRSWKFKVDGHASSGVGVLISMLQNLIGFLWIGFLAQWIWNHEIHQITGWSQVGYWQAIFVILLCQLIYRNTHPTAQVELIFSKRKKKRE